MSNTFPSFACKDSSGLAVKVDRMLEDGYQPHPFDVICKRDRKNISHAGNNRFLMFVETRVDRYMTAGTRKEKTKIVQEIIDAVHGSGGRFIRQQDSFDTSLHSSMIREQGLINFVVEREMKDVYFEIGRKKVADKVGHALRLAVSRRESRSSRRQSWPVRSKASMKTEQEALVWDGGYEGDPIPNADAMNHEYMENLTPLRSVMDSRYIANEIAVEYPALDMPTTKAKGRRQSWHAGFTTNYEKRSNIAAPINCPDSGLLACETNPLWFEQFVLNNLAVLEGSLETTAESITFENDPFENDNLSLDESLLDLTNRSED